MTSSSSSAPPSPQECWRDVKLSPAKQKCMANPVKFLPLRDDSIPRHKYGFFHEVWESENLSRCKTKAEQAWVIQERCEAMSKQNPEDGDWQFSGTEKGFCVGVKRQGFSSLVSQWQNIISTKGGRMGGRPKVLGEKEMVRLKEYVAECDEKLVPFVGRPKVLGEKEMVRLKEYVAECDEKLVPLLQTSLLGWVNKEFDVHQSLTWLKDLITSTPGLFLVSAEPLEKTRREVTAEQLKGNAKILEEKLACENPELVMNMDETSLDTTRPTKTLSVVSSQACPRTYIADRGESHITFVPTYGITGWSLPTMVILPSATFVGVLADRYGFPCCHHAYLTSSSSASINEELFSVYVDKILVPGVKARRRFLDLPSDAGALLILDGCLAHSEEKLRELSKHHIDYHFIVPHSSHLTQPLDRGLFSTMKRMLPNQKSCDTDNKVGKRVMCGLSALQKSATFQNVRSSFWRAGFELNYEDGVPGITMNVETWLTQHNSPQSEDKEESYVRKALRKRKRVDVQDSGKTKKERGKEEKEKEKEKNEREKEKNDRSEGGNVRKESLSIPSQYLSEFQQ